jgi:hypothetical protein
MAVTYEAIATQTLGSATSSVTFSSIPSTYTDLYLVTNVSRTTAAGAIYLDQINSDSGSNYSFTYMYGNGSAASSGRASGGTESFLGDISTTPSSVNISLQNYSNSTTYKTWLSRASASANAVAAVVGLWRSTSAINTFRIRTSTGTFDAGSTFTLYGIKAA